MVCVSVYYLSFIFQILLTVRWGYYQALKFLKRWIVLRSLYYTHSYSLGVSNLEFGDISLPSSLPVGFIMVMWLFQNGNAVHDLNNDYITFTCLPQLIGASMFLKSELEDAFKRKYIIDFHYFLCSTWIIWKYWYAWCQWAPILT